MPTTSTGGVIHQSEGESVWELRRTRGGGKKTANTSPTKFLVDEQDDGDQPCKICTKTVGDEGAKCDRCNGWVHVGCSGLTKKEYEYLTYIASPAVKFYCKTCLTDMNTGGDKTDQRLATQEAKMDTLMQVVDALQSQNKEIVKLLNINETKVVDTLQTQNKEIIKHLNNNESKINETTKEKLNEVLVEEKEREKRKNNIIIHNIPEESQEEQGEDKIDDKERVTAILRQIGVDIEEPEIENIYRLGSKSGRDGKPREKPRLLKVVLKTEEKKRDVMKKAPNLNKGVEDKAKKVYINNDETDKERKANFELRQKLKQKRQETGDQTWVIDRKTSEIVQKKEKTRPAEEGNQTEENTQ